MKFISLVLLALIIITSGLARESSNKILGLKNPKIQIGKLKLDVILAITDKEQQKGLSGLRSNQFSENQSMLFFYKSDSPKSFWMPDTYFNLDIIFLDKELKVVHIEKDVPAHPGRQEPPPIYRTPQIMARHVLEIKADSPASKIIKKGMKLKWISSTSLLQIESKTRLWR